MAGAAGVLADATAKSLNWNVRMLRRQVGRRAVALWDYAKLLPHMGDGGCGHQVVNLGAVAVAPQGWAKHCGTLGLSKAAASHG